MNTLLAAEGRSSAGDSAGSGPGAAASRGGPVLGGGLEPLPVGGPPALAQSPRLCFPGGAHRRSQGDYQAPPLTSDLPRSHPYWALSKRKDLRCPLAVLLSAHTWNIFSSCDLQDIGMGALTYMQVKCFNWTPGWGHLFL